MAPAIGLGIARFAYALLLPEMSTELNWTYSQAGWMNTINAAGYLIGALVTAPLVKYLSLSTVLRVGVAITVLAVLFTGATDHFGVLSFLRLLAGISGALCFVAGGAIAAVLATRSVSLGGLVLSLFYAGPGVGIVLSGLALPAFVQSFGTYSWAGAWVLAGYICLALAVFFFKTPIFDGSSQSGRTGQLPRFSCVSSIWVLSSYLCFGAGYIGYMTFMFAYLKETGSTTLELTLFWTCIGAASIASPWLWAGVITKMRGGMAMAFLTAVTLVGAAMPLGNTSLIALFLSALIFGSAFFSLSAATTAFATRNANADQWPYVIGVFTVVFGAGQVVGPVLIGAISDNSGSLFSGLVWGCFFLVLATILPLLQKDVRTHVVQLS